MPYNKLLTSLVRAVQASVSPRPFLYGPRCARSILPCVRANIPQYGPSAWSVGRYYFLLTLDHYAIPRRVARTP